MHNLGYEGTVGCNQTLLSNNIPAISSIRAAMSSSSSGGISLITSPVSRSTTLTTVLPVFSWTENSSSFLFIFSRVLFILSSDWPVIPEGRSLSLSSETFFHSSSDRCRNFPYRIPGEDLPGVATTSLILSLATTGREVVEILVVMEFAGLNILLLLNLHAARESINRTARTREENVSSPCTHLQR